MQGRTVEGIMLAGIQDNVVVFHFVWLMSCFFDCKMPRGSDTDMGWIDDGLGDIGE